MIVVLIGYMASGKSTIGRVLAKKLDYNFIDLDDYIEATEKESISDIFETSGEIYFRKRETQYLNEIIANKNNIVLALGGGTPCYGNNMETVLNSEHVTSIYLKTTIASIVERLETEKDKRPLVSHLNTTNELSEFVGKHLFERVQFYSKAKYIVDTNNKNIEEIIEEIIFNLF
ncbi:Shikimate kinase I [hydrothermal vent metagenome]|uniref:Shikimate kinase I n=1 Tax=hydrothermal vent metagenome TaxID=652676 RepID=A0A3B0QVR3_9ZZZZ